MRLAPAPQRSTLLPIALALVATAACSNAVRPRDGAVPTDRPAPTPDRAAPPEDAPAPPEDAPQPPIDAPLPWDAPTPLDDGPVPTDAPLPPPDVPAPIDAPLPTCVGAADTCATAAGCPDLAGARMRPVSFAGASVAQPISCGPAGAPDVALPVTITATSDLELVVTPTGGSTVAVALFRAPDCAPASELRCGTSMGAFDARLRAPSLPPGRYLVVVRSTGGTPAFVSAVVSPPPMAPPGDRCPGVVETPDDGMFASVNTGAGAYATDPDVGTSCGPGADGANATDVVFQYTLTSTRDVTIDVTASSFGGLSVEVLATCGARLSAAAPCQTSGTSAYRRTIRSQPAGTYYVVVEWAVFGMSPTPRALAAQVTTAPPTAPPPGDRCPGVPLTVGVPHEVALAGLERDFALACVTGTSTANPPDAVFSLTAPPPGNDVIALVRSTEATPRPVGMQLLTGGCPGAPEGACRYSGFRGGPVFQRYRGLAPGAAYHLVGQTSATSGGVEATYWSVPAVRPTVVTGNDACSTIPTPVIAGRGGLFEGDLAGQINDTNPPSGCSCGTGGRDVVYRLDVTARSRVLASVAPAAGAPTGFLPILYVLSGATCDAATGSSSLCSPPVATGTPATLAATLDAGTYWLVVDACSSFAAGPYTLDVAIVPP